MGQEGVCALLWGGEGGRTDRFSKGSASSPLPGGVGGFFVATTLLGAVEKLVLAAGSKPRGKFSPPSRKMTTVRAEKRAVNWSGA